MRPTVVDSTRKLHNGKHEIVVYDEGTSRTGLSHDAKPNGKPQ